MGRPRLPSFEEEIDKVARLHKASSRMLKAKIEYLAARAELVEATRSASRSVKGANPQAPAIVGKLSPRLKQVLSLLCKGRSQKEIAAELCISPRTVKYHVSQLFDRFGVRKTGELVRALEGEV